MPCVSVCSHIIMPTPDRAWSDAIRLITRMAHGQGPCYRNAGLIAQALLMYSGVTVCWPCVQGDPAQVLPRVSVCTVLDAMRAHYAASGPQTGQPHEATPQPLDASDTELTSLRAGLLAVCGHLMEARMRLVGSFRPEDVQVGAEQVLKLTHLSCISSKSQVAV